jgi:rubrerythrin
MRSEQSSRGGQGSDAQMTLRSILMKESTQKSLDAVSQGINSELAAYVFYKMAVDKIKDSGLKSLLERLAGEEKDHYWTLEAEYDSLARSEKWVTYNDIMRKSGLPEIPEDMDPVHKNRLAELDKTSDPQKILSLAIELEERARDFYQSQIDKVGDPAAIEVYTYLVKFEQGHINVIKGWMRKG